MTQRKGTGAQRFVVRNNKHQKGDWRVATPEDICGTPLPSPESLTNPQHFLNNF